jgi:hypothetical protein
MKQIKTIKIPSGIEKYYKISQKNGLIRIKRKTFASTYGPFVFLGIILIYAGATVYNGTFTKGDGIFLAALAIGVLLYFYFNRALIFNLKTRKINRKGGIRFENINSFVKNGSIMDDPLSGQNKSVYSIRAELKNSDKTVNLMGVNEKSIHDPLIELFNRIVMTKS